MSASLAARDLTVSRGPQLLIADANFVVAPGDRLGLVGPNGIGKSSLLAVLAGQDPPESGTVSVSPPTANVGWLHQERSGQHRAGDTTADVLRRRTGVTDAEAALTDATAALADGAGDAADRYDAALNRWLALGCADFDARIGEVAAEVGLPARVLAQPVGTLSGGEAARVGLAALLLSRFDVYLLDEPTNDLDLTGLEQLETWLAALDAGVVVVSHDRRFLERVVTSVVEIDHHAHTVRVFGGGWQAFLDERERARQRHVERYETFETQRQQLRARAQRQREWAQQGQAKVRRSGETDKYIRAFKINQTEQLAGKAAQTQRAIERLETVESPREPWELRLTIPDAPRSGDRVVAVRGAVVERGDFRLGPIDATIDAGDRIALTGANGAGKSTLIDLLLGRTAPTAGEVQPGSGVVVGEIEQTRRQLVGDASLGRTFADATGLNLGDSRTLLAKFGLVGAHVERPTASLSPGERTRAALALLMANGANLLVLDEPTNHLDMPAIEQLEQALDTYRGTLVLVTHDRELLNNVTIDRRWHLDHGTLSVST